MKNASNQTPKRAYNAPKLVSFGDMAQLTKAGGTSVTEGGTGMAMG